MLPLGLLNLAQGQPMLVELKDGTTLNGMLEKVDTYMNVILKEVVETNPDGDKFTRLAEVFARGNNIKYLRMPDEVAEEAAKEQKAAPNNNRGGGRGGRGGDRGGRGGRGNNRGGRGTRGA